MLAKEQAETVAEQLKSVATIEKEAALIVANRGLEVATIAALEADQNKIATIKAAEGKQQAIELSGAITEKEEILAKIAAQRDVSISANIMKIAVPTTMFIGGGSEGGNGSGNGDYFGNLLSYTIAQSAGLIPNASPNFAPSPVAPVQK